MPDRQANARAVIGTWLRRLADRIDYKGAPKITHYSFTIEPQQGLVFRNDGQGCPVAYLGDGAYRRAFTEADYQYPAAALARPQGSIHA